MDSKKGLMQQRNRKRKTCIWLHVLLWVLMDRTSKKYKFSIGMFSLDLLKPELSDTFYVMNLWLIIAVTHTTWAVVKLKPEKNSGLNGIRTHDLCDTGAVLYWLSYQAIWELVTLWVRNIPINSINSYLSLQFKYMIFHTFIYILYFLQVYTCIYM